jgi:hypothetical protein
MLSADASALRKLPEKIRNLEMPRFEPAQLRRRAPPYRLPKCSRHPRWRAPDEARVFLWRQIHFRCWLALHLRSLYSEASGTAQRWRGRFKSIRSLQVHHRWLG